MIKYKHIIYVSISFIFFFVTNFIYAAEFSWKFNNGLPETRNESKELDRFADDVKNATNGGLNIKIYHNLDRFECFIIILLTLTLIHSITTVQ